MKKLLFILVFLPLFATAETPVQTDDSYQQAPQEQQSSYANEYGNAQDSQAESLFRYRRSRMALCGRHSDYQCAARRVTDSCERDSSHGIYGRCVSYGQRGTEVVCGCR